MSNSKASGSCFGSHDRADRLYLLQVIDVMPGIDTYHMFNPELVADFDGPHSLLALSRMHVPGLTLSHRQGSGPRIYPRKREKHKSQDQKLYGARLAATRAACKPLGPVIGNVEQVTSKGLAIISGVRLREHHHVRVVGHRMEAYGKPQSTCAP